MSTTLLRSTSESQGVPSAAILAFIEETEKAGLELHSLMLLRHGRIVAEGWWSPYSPDRPHVLHSLSKSFTSTAVGMAVDEGRLTVDDFVLSYFPEDAPKRSGEHLRAMRVRHLLSMSTGHDQDTTGYMHRSKDGNWARAFLARPVVHEPGTHFLYNTGATYMLSAIVQKLTGQTLLEYLSPRLFTPLGIEGATWESCPRGVNTGGFGLSIKTEDIAKFGQLYLKRGAWEGRQLVSQAWVAEAAAKQVSNGDDPNSDWAQGYGYQFWRCRHGAYRGDGAFGQYCLVMPDQDAALAITGGVKDMQAVLNLIWIHLLPAMSRYPLPPDDEREATLHRKLVALALPLPKRRSNSPLADEVSGKTYIFPENRPGIETVRLDFGADAVTVKMRDGRGEHVAACGMGRRIEGESSFIRVDGGPHPVAAAGAWTAPNTYTAQLCFCEQGVTLTATHEFAQDALRYRLEVNVGFGPTKTPLLVGRLAA